MTAKKKIPPKRKPGIKYPSKQRKESNTVINWSCSNQMKERVRNAALADNRSVSSWLSNYVDQMLKIQKM